MLPPLLSLFPSLRAARREIQALELGSVCVGVSRPASNLLLSSAVYSE